MTSFNEIIHHVNVFYIAGNKGIKTVFNIENMAEKSGLDPGASLKNMETFFSRISNLAYDFGMVKYVQTEDIVKLAKHLMLSRDLATWENYQADISPGKTSGTNSLSQSVLQTALHLILDPLQA